MSIRPERVDYSIAQKALHWVIAILIIADLIFAQEFSTIMADADRFELRNNHATVGIIIAVLVAVRLYLRLRNGAPALPVDMPGWQKSLSRFVHWAFYVLIGILALTGISSTFFADSVVMPFGLISLGDGVGSGLPFYPIRGFHEAMTMVLKILIFLHVLAALYHLVIRRDGVAGRMLKFWKTDG